MNGSKIRNYWMNENETGKYTIKSKQGQEIRNKDHVPMYISHVTIILYSNTAILLPKKQRLTGKDVIFMTRKRQYLSQGLFWFFYIKQYPGIKYNQFSCHITIKLSKRSVVRHVFKRAIIQRIQQHNLVKYPINDMFYKIFIVLSKDRIPEIEKKIANFEKKDTIMYIQEEFEKARKWLTNRLYGKK